MTKEQFAKLIFALAGNFGTEIQPATLDIWFAMAREDGITYQEMQAAAQKIMRTKAEGYGRMPAYAEILEAIRGQPPKVEHRATAEASRIIEHLNTYGATTLPDLSGDPITRRLMTTRWPYKTWAAKVAEAKIDWWIKDFVEAYRAIEATGGALPAIEAPKRVRPLLESIGAQIGGGEA